MQPTIGVEHRAASGREAEVTVRTLSEQRNSDGERRTDDTTDYLPSPGQLTLLIGGMAVAVVATIYAFNRSRHRLLNDPRNIDRRWDRPDRLVDTRYEDERWQRRGGRADHRAGLRSHAEGFAV